MANEPIFSFAALQNRLVVRGNLVALTALRIGAGRSSNIIGNDLPVLRDALNAPFVPGASLKGAFRARVESLIRAVHDDQARDLPGIEEHMRDAMIPLIQANRTDENDSGLSEKIWNKSTLIDLTFGAPWVAGRIFFKDALVDRKLWFDQYEIRNGVALNRDTETVEQGLLYDYEVVPAGVRFDFELMVENAAPWQLGMVLLALRPWQNGDVQIGGFRSRGLGHIQLADIRASYTNIQTAEDVLTLLGYGESGAINLPLARLPGVQPTPDSAEPPLEELPEPLKSWFNEFKRALTNPTTVIAEGATFDA